MLTSPLCHNSSSVFLGGALQGFQLYFSFFFFFRLLTHSWTARGLSRTSFTRLFFDSKPHFSLCSMLGLWKKKKKKETSRGNWGTTNCVLWLDVMWTSLPLANIELLRNLFKGMQAFILQWTHVLVCSFCGQDTGSTLFWDFNGRKKRNHGQPVISQRRKLNERLQVNNKFYCVFFFFKDCPKM